MLWHFVDLELHCIINVNYQQVHNNVYWLWYINILNCPTFGYYENEKREKLAAADGSSSHCRRYEASERIMALE